MYIKITSQEKKHTSLLSIKGGYLQTSDRDGIISFKWHKKRIPHVVLVRLIGLTVFDVPSDFMFECSDYRKENKASHILCTQIGIVCLK